MTDEIQKAERQNPLLIVAPDIWERLFNGQSAMTIAVEPQLDVGNFGLILANGQVMEFNATPQKKEVLDGEVTSH